MIGVTSDGTRHPAALIALAATSVPSRISARPTPARTSAPDVPLTPDECICHRGRRKNQ